MGGGGAGRSPCGEVDMSSSVAFSSPAAMRNFMCFPPQTLPPVFYGNVGCLLGSVGDRGSRAGCVMCRVCCVERYGIYAQELGRVW